VLRKSKEKVILCQRAPGLLQFNPLVVSLSEIVQERVFMCFHVEYTPHPALKGLSHSSEIAFESQT